MKSDDFYMTAAMAQALEAQSLGEVPVGAVLVDEAGRILAASGNSTRTRLDPTGHAEMNVLRRGAQALGNYRLEKTSLFVTLEPCAMCAGAISHARISRLIIAARDPKGGAVWHGPKFFDQPTCHWRPEIVQGPYGDKAGEMLRAFFRDRRSKVPRP